MTMIRQLSLFLSCVSMCSMAMNHQEQWYLQLKTKDVDYALGASIRYFNEYKAQLRDEGNTVSFPLKATDPLPIYQCGDKRFFVTSAQQGSMGYMGSPCKILDPSINKMVVVRAKAESNGNTGQYYIGFDIAKFTTAGYKGKDRIYTGIIMHVARKENNTHQCGYSWYGSYTPNDKLLTHFSFSDIYPVIRGDLLQKEDMNAKSPVFRQKAKEVCSEFESHIDFDRQLLSFTDVYWTQEENKLKGITYRR